MALWHTWRFAPLAHPKSFLKAYETLLHWRVHPYKHKNVSVPLCNQIIIGKNLSSVSALVYLHKSSARVFLHRCICTGVLVLANLPRWICMGKSALLCLHMYICTCISAYVYMLVYLHGSSCTGLYKWMYLHGCICMDVSSWMYQHGCISMDV